MSKWKRSLRKQKKNKQQQPPRNIIKLKFSLRKSYPKVQLVKKLHREKRANCIYVDLLLIANELYVE